MICGKRANKHSLDSLERTTVKELLDLIRTNPYLRNVWVTKFNGVRRRDVLCQVLFWKDTVSMFYYRNKPVDLKDIKIKYMKDTENLIYKMEVPFSTIHADQFTIVRNSGIPKRFREDIKDFFVYNSATDTFGMFTGDDEDKKYFFIEFQVLGVHNYKILKVDPLDYNASFTPNIKTPKGYIGLSFK